MTHDTDHAVPRKLIGLIFLCLAVRIVTPAGYMPAPIAEGGPFVLCPGGMSGASLILAAQARAAGQHDGHHAHDADHSTRFAETCPFVVVFGSAVIVTDLQIVFPEIQQILLSTSPQLWVQSTALHPFHARAPPPLTSRSV